MWILAQKINIKGLVKFHQQWNMIFDRGEKHYDSNHIVDFTLADDIIRGICQASMKNNKSYNPTVSLFTFGSFIFNFMLLFVYV